MVRWPEPVQWACALCAGLACCGVAIAAFELSGDDTWPWLLWVGAQTVCALCIGLWLSRLAVAKTALIVVIQMAFVVARVWMAGDPPGRDRSTGGAAGLCILISLLLFAAPVPLAAAAADRSLLRRRSAPTED